MKGNKMNERIRPLAEQLGPVATIGNWGRVKWADDVYPQFGDKMYAAIDLERFAELIVRECARRAEAYAYMSPNFTALAEELRRMKGVEE